MKMRTILPLALSLVPALLAGCASGPPEPTHTVARDERGHLVIEPIQRSDEYYPAAYPPSYYNPGSRKSDLQKVPTPKFNFPK